jgi:hypothetical protein
MARPGLEVERLAVDQAKECATADGAPIPSAPPQQQSCDSRRIVGNAAVVASSWFGRPFPLLRAEGSPMTS